MVFVGLGTIESSLSLVLRATSVSSILSTNLPPDLAAAR